MIRPMWSLFSRAACYGKRKIFQDDNISQIYVDIADLGGCYSYFLLNPNPSNWQISTPPKIKFLFGKILSMYFFFPLNGIKRHLKLSISPLYQAHKKM